MKNKTILRIGSREKNQAFSVDSNFLDNLKTKQTNKTKQKQKKNSFQSEVVTSLIPGQRRQRGRLCNQVQTGL